MRKVFSVLSLAAVAASGIVASASPALAKSGGPRTESGYATFAISGYDRPVFADRHAGVETRDSGLEMLADGRAERLHNLGQKNAPLAEEDGPDGRGMTGTQAQMMHSQGASNADDMMYSDERKEYGDRETPPQFDDDGLPLDSDATYP